MFIDTPYKECSFFCADQPREDVFAPFSVIDASELGKSYEKNSEATKSNAADAHETFQPNHGAKFTENTRDEIIQQLKGAENVQDVFDIIPPRGAMSEKAVLAVFQTLFHLYKTDRYTQLSSN